MTTKVLHVVGNLELGGGQKLAALVAMALDPDEFDVTVLSLGSPGSYGPRLEARGIEVISFGLGQPVVRNGPTKLVRALVSLVHLLFSREWDIVHTHMFSSAAVVAPLARLRGARVFGTAHRIYYGRVQPVAERALAVLNERIVVDSHSVLEILQTRTHIPKAKYTVIYNCVDRSQFDERPDRRTAREDLALDEDAFVVTEIAHLRRHKGQEHLLRATAALVGRGVRLQVLLVGGGPDEPHLRSLAESLGVADMVRLLGPRDDLGRILAATDVLALPSEYEGFGIVQAEAMYFSLPVVATSYGGSTEVVVDGSTGFLVPFGDVDGLADRIGQLLHDEALRQSMGAAGRRRVDEMFSMEALGDSYAALYAPR